ncbi:hypothetical protein JCM1840_002512 [Sporobolomyces johnsonii]
MVLIDGVKYACQTCIKGHRSSKCTHTNRPLIEIKKKGRPTSQCAHCRELRKTRSVHGRCDCVARDQQDKPAARVLPNGLVDAMLPPAPQASTSGSTEVLKSGVTRLLNPCNCRRGGPCTCCEVVSRAAPKAFPGDSPSPSASSPASPPSCCSPPPAPLPSASSSTFEPYALPLPPSLDIPVPPSSPYQLPIPPSILSTFSPSLPLPLPFPPPSKPPSDPLFLPKTHGTSSCFCGPTCQCVGCAVHDPYSRKRAGGGCRCGDAGDEGQRDCFGMGKKARRAGEGEGEGERDGGGGGCCGKKKLPEECEHDVDPETMGTGTGTGIDLPVLWAREDLFVDDGASARRGSTPDAFFAGTVAPLPSLKTLWPALLESSSSSAPAPSSPTPPGQSFMIVENAGCSSMYADELFDGGCGAACECSSGCGCRGGIGAGDPDGVEAEEGERSPETGKGKGVVVRFEQLAELAAMGAFG